MPVSHAISLRLFMRVVHLFMDKEFDKFEELVFFSFLGMLLFESDQFLELAAERIRSLLDEDERFFALFLIRKFCAAPGRAISTLRQFFLDDEDRHVRQYTIAHLHYYAALPMDLHGDYGRFALHGNGGLLEKISDFARDDCEDVREVAWEFLSRFSREADVWIIANIYKAGFPGELNASTENLVCQAKVLAALGFEGVALSSLLWPLGHAFSICRKEALQAIAEAFAQGVFQDTRREACSWAVGPVAALLMDPDSTVGRAAGAAIVQMTDTGDARACSLVGGLIKIDPFRARSRKHFLSAWRALDVFGKISRPGDPVAINLVLELMRDSYDKHEREECVYTIAEIAGKACQLFNFQDEIVGDYRETRSLSPIRKVCWFLSLQEVCQLRRGSRAWLHCCFFPKHDD